MSPFLEKEILTKFTRLIRIYKKHYKNMSLFLLFFTIKSTNPYSCDFKWPSSFKFWICHLIKEDYKTPEIFENISFLFEMLKQISKTAN